MQAGKTAVVMVESPTNPRMQICDIAAIADIAHAGGAICSVDNRCCSQDSLLLASDIPHC